MEFALFFGRISWKVEYGPGILIGILGIALAIFIFLLGLRYADERQKANEDQHGQTRDTVKEEAKKTRTAFENTSKPKTISSKSKIKPAMNREMDRAPGIDSFSNTKGPK